MDSSIYYDNSNSIDADGFLEIDRVYCLRLGDFTDSDWAVLSERYKTLPRWCGPGEHGFPCWFGSAEKAPYLIASVEPSGLQIFGAVPPDSLERWHESFVVVCQELPHFEA